MILENIVEQIVEPVSAWRPMSEAQTDREILVRDADGVIYLAKWDDRDAEFEDDYDHIGFYARHQGGGDYRIHEPVEWCEVPA